MSAIDHPAAGDAQGLLEQLWIQAGLSAAALEHVSIGGEPLLPSCFRVGDIAATCIAASGLGAAEIWRQRSGRMQSVSVDMAHAEIAYRSERYLEVTQALPDPFNPFWGYYRTADARWFQIHTSFPHHLSGALELLGLGMDAVPETVREAVSGWNGLALEEEMARRGLVGALMRSRAEWLAHPHGKAISQAPLMEIERIGEAPPALPGAASRPLQGLRVLDLTRVIAGPVCGRTLAEHGADVLRIQAPHVPYIPRLAVDTGRGKRSTWLDLREAGDRARFESLLRDADVMVQGYRPYAVASRGYGPAEVAGLRPGIVYVSICAYGYEGPWAGRRGFDSLVQMASGIARAGADAMDEDAPHPLPCQALDHCVGYLAAFGAMAALVRRSNEGGSWHVRLSLARVSEWLQRLGQVDGLLRPEPTAEEVASVLERADSAFGPMRFVKPVSQLSETPAHWSRPPAPMGCDAPQWLTG